MSTTCENDAVYRFTWPGQDESFICEDHVKWLQNVANAMGLHLQIIPLEKDVSEKCRQSMEKK